LSLDNQPGLKSPPEIILLSEPTLQQAKRKISENSICNVHPQALTTKTLLEEAIQP